MSSTITISGGAYSIGQLTVRKAQAIAELYEVAPKDGGALFSGPGVSLIPAAVKALSECTEMCIGDIESLPLHELVSGVRQLLIAAQSWAPYIGNVLTPEVAALGETIAAFEAASKGANGNEDQPVGAQKSS